MFFKTVIIFVLINAFTISFARILQVQNIATVPLLVSVTGQDDITLLNGSTALVEVDENFSGSISAIRSDSETVDQPRTKVELTLSATTEDLYAVSLIDGFNLKAKIIPIQGTNCTASVCAADLITNCPVDNLVVNSLGVSVACRSSPLVFRTICPKAVVTTDDAKNVLICRAASYRIFLG